MRGSVAGRRRGDRILARMRRIGRRRERAGEAEPSQRIPDTHSALRVAGTEAEERRGTGTWIDRSRRLAKGRGVSLSNQTRARAAAARAGRGLLIGMALVFVAGLVW